MCSRLLRYSRNALVLIACAVCSVGACTFPTVDYADSGGSTGGCSAPSVCAANATKCGDDARRTFDNCTHMCTMGKPQCLPDCDNNLSVTLGQCNAACQSCAADQGCTDASSSCKALVGG